MEWVETTARSLEEAKELALDQLGVAADEAEFDVLEEPKAGLFGRVRGEARVRARVRPTPARQKVERRDKRKRGVDGSSEIADRPAADAEPTERPERARPSRPRAPRPAKAAATMADSSDMTDSSGSSGSTSQTATDADVKERPSPRRSPSNTPEENTVNATQVGEEARRFVEELVHRFGLQGDVTLVEDGDDLEVHVAGDDLGLLVGPRGTTLQALQDLTRVASQRRLGDHDTRLRVDVGGYRSRRREALGAFALKVAADVRESGSPVALEAMNSADRKVVHDALSAVDGVSTRSEGDDPNRRVIVDPAQD